MDIMGNPYELERLRRSTYRTRGWGGIGQRRCVVGGPVTRTIRRDHTPVASGERTVEARLAELSRDAKDRGTALIRDATIWLVLSLPFVGKAVREFHEMLDGEN